VGQLDQYDLRTQAAEGRDIANEAIEQEDEELREAIRRDNNNNKWHT
jgi:hypothetical protein